ncbi:MAG: ABC transporter ATP-binding protein [Candidatus Delongbacteria bacterium]|nr:ABC transporter ATP-binding protein [Candidatus Delongbacteria bacterium]
MSTAIKFENISKQYRLGLVSTNTISHDLNRWWKMNIRGQEDPYLKIGDVNDRSTKANSDYVWALKDINFEVQQGDVLGIIGKNGAGKSTLLKILSKVTSPSTGSIRAKGRIASLLEVGTGFHPELTGRENIYMNGAIMGMNKAEITRKLDEIVDFSGCERYIDTPVKRYSSGMTVRLGFAIAAHLDPEILVVDEVLAVGDAEFQKKAIGKMQDVSKGEGRTVLFVSHNLASINKLCTKGIVLKDGMISCKGPISDCVNYYLDTNEKFTKTIIENVEFCHSAIEINSIKVNGSELNVLNVNSENSSFEIFIVGKLKEPKFMSLELRMHDQNELPLAFFTPGHKTGVTPFYERGEFHIEYSVNLPSNMNKGSFLIDIALTHPAVEYLLKVPNGLHIHSAGCTTETGLVFEYSKNCGLLLL